MADLDFIPKHIDRNGLSEKQIAYWRHHADKPARLAEMFIPEIRPVPVDQEYGGREVQGDEHLKLVEQAAELRTWLIKWFGLVSEDRLCVRVPQNRSAKPAGALAGSVGNHGYLVTRAMGKLRLNHHLIFLLYYGRLPAPGMVIDHIDGNRQNNRIENLREVTNQGNMLNASTNDRSLPHGLSRAMKGGTYHYIRAYISIPAAARVAGTPKQRIESIAIAPWPKNEDGTPVLGEDGQPLRNEDELLAIATLAPLYRAWREELYASNQLKLPTLPT